ncbi:MAG TPA: hypothetical protein VIG85_09090 [Comamonas sp.]
MSTVAPSTVDRSEDKSVPITALAALEQDARWLNAGDNERAVLKRIALQRDRLAAAKQAQQQARALRAQVDAVPADAPFAERLMVFAKLHPVATAAVAGVALMVGPRKLLRWGTLALPLISKLKR